MTGAGRRLVRRLPAWMRRQPIEVMVCLVGIPTGLLSLAGLATSRALDQVLPWWVTKLWALCLIAGCAAWLGGLTSAREVDGRMVLWRLPLLLLGLRLLSTAAAVYGVAIVVTAGWAGVLASWPLWVVALGTTVRRLDLADRVRR
ncbi:hypothetical protein AB0M95_40410 [Sphaerisporangium sp. NPDC051017]|uniref:hypothetical protein n=1 Tax=Sphaerisporangium sp. NPDC051017 TaxID=3154636 RepID=UPI00343B8493